MEIYKRGKCGFSCTVIYLPSSRLKSKRAIMFWSPFTCYLHSFVINSISNFKGERLLMLMYQRCVWVTSNLNALSRILSLTNHEARCGDSNLKSHCANNVDNGAFCCCCFRISKRTGFHRGADPPNSNWEPQLPSRPEPCTAEVLAGEGWEACHR